MTRSRLNRADSIAIQIIICRGAACCARRTEDGCSKQRPYGENLYLNIYKRGGKW